jgi:hypothetical protein
MWDIPFTFAIPAGWLTAILFFHGVSKFHFRLYPSPEVFRFDFY